VITILDVAYPSTPDQLVADLQAIGAHGCAGYVLDLALEPPTTWTPAHAQALEQAGLIFLPIVTPGDLPPPAAGCWGWWSGSGPIALDLEAGSTPAGAWVQAWCQAVRARGGSPGLYGGTAIQPAYGGLGFGWRWLASWVTTHPTTLPAGYAAWQWTDQMWIHGRRYDASIFDEGVFELATIDDVLTLANAINDRTGQIWNLLDWGTPVGGAVPQGWGPTQWAKIDQALALLSQIAKASVPGDLTQLIQDVADLKAAIARIETALKGA